MTTEIICQAPDPRSPDGIHGARLAKVSLPAKPTAKLLDDLEDVGCGEHGAWCHKCGVVTVYREARAEAA